MAPPRFLMPHLLRWLTSDARLHKARRRHARRRVAGTRTFEFFYRVDDPLSHVMAQALQLLRPMLQGELFVHVVERLPANAYPDPARYEALTVIDSQRLADVYGLDLPEIGKVAERLSVQMASRYLAGIDTGDRCLDQAVQLGDAVWRGDSRAVHAQCGMAAMTDAELRAGEKRLAELGHYASAAVYYEGEFYVGPDRLYHLIERLAGEGLAVPDDPRVQMLARRLDWQDLPSLQAEQFAAHTAQVFFSVRSPYSYLLLAQLPALVSHTRLRIVPRPVLPMLMRGLPVPPAKRRYILFDATREARARHLPFGRVSDPLGPPTERAMAIGLSLDDPSDQMAYFLSYMQAVWAEGRPAYKDSTHIFALSRAGLPSQQLLKALPPQKWRAIADQNRQDMMRRGAWGVPSIATEKGLYWGQDRLWAVTADLMNL